MESPNTTSQELNPSCSRLAISTGLALFMGIKAQKPKCILTILRLLSIIRPLEARMPYPARLFKRFRAAGTNGRLDLSLS